LNDKFNRKYHVFRQIDITQKLSGTALKDRF